MKKMQIMGLMIILIIVCQGCLHSCIEDEKLPPILRILAPEDVTSSAALLRAEITDIGTEPIISIGFYFVKQLDKDPHTTLYPSNIFGEGIVVSNQASNNFQALIENLEFNTHYFVRAYAQTASRIYYSEVLRFLTKMAYLIDIDGNAYPLVKIGDQIWTASNLKVTRLRDGTPIPYRVDGFYWYYNGPEEPAMSWYDHDRARHEELYGALYNWFAASHPLIAPEGWRVPTYDDAGKLREAIMSIEDGQPSYDSENTIGGKMKIPGTTYWEAPNIAATNVSGFSAYPAGEMWGGNFFDKHRYTYFWFSSEMNNSLGRLGLLSSQHGLFMRQVVGPKHVGISIRLVKE